MSDHDPRAREPDDLDFLVELVTHEDVEPFLAAGARARRRGDARGARALASASLEAFGRFVIEVDGRRARGRWRFERAQRAQPDRATSAASPSTRTSAAVDSADEAARLFQRHLFYELGFHRLELEIYGFNERAIATPSGSGFVARGREAAGVRRHGEWVDGVSSG